MADMETYDQLGEALKRQCERFGPTALSDRRRVVSLLADTLPDARRDIRAVASALDEGVPAALTGVERSLLGMEMDRQAERLESNLGMRSDIARQVVRALAFALDLGPRPSVYEVATPAEAPRPSQADWAGLSQGPAPSHHAPQPQPQPQAGTGTAPLMAGLAGGAPIAFLGRSWSRGSLILAGGGVVLAALVVMTLSQGLGGGGPGGATDVQGGYAGELFDQGVPEKNELESNVGSPTPMTIPGARRVTTQEVTALVERQASTLLVDVLADPHSTTVRGAVYLPLLGQPGVFTDAAQTQTVQQLQALTGGDVNRPLVFFCAGAACWESYNAVLRARAAGYRDLYWYRGGLASWSSAGLPMQPLPSPGVGTPSGSGTGAPNLFMSGLSG